MEAIKVLNEQLPNSTTPTPFTKLLTDWKQKCYDALLDDFNSPILIAHLFEAVKWVFQVKNAEESITSEELQELKTLMNAFVFEVLGLEEEQSTSGRSQQLEGVLELLISMRMEARANKDWKLSDKIRDELLALGIQLKDGKEGTSYTIN